MSFLKQSVLALKVLIWVLIASFGVFLIATVGGVIHEHSHALERAHEEAQASARNGLKSISLALWTYDRPGLSALLQGMTRVPSIAKIEIFDVTNIVAEVRSIEPGKREDSVWIFPILALEGNARIGTMRVSESYAEVDKQTLGMISTLVVTELAKIVGLALILFVIVYRKIARHLHDLAHSVSNLAPGDLDARVSLDRNASSGNGRDELDTLVGAINQFLKERGERSTELSQQLRFLQQLIEAIPGPVYYKDASIRYLGCNSAFEAFIGRPASEMIGKTPHDISTPETADKIVAADRELLKHPGRKIYESPVRTAGGDIRNVMIHKATFTASDGAVGGIVGVMLDITDRKRMEDDLRQAATIFKNSAERVTITSADGSIIAVNPAFQEITGYDENEVIGRNPKFLQSGRHDKRFYQEMWEGISRDGHWQGEIWNRRKNGEIYPEWISISAVLDKQNRVTNYVGTSSDITKRKQTEEKIQQLAYSDPLTNLPNRRLLIDRLQQSLAASSRNKRFGALFFIDLDDFKDLNDTLGHDQGDLLLQQVAERLVGCVREGDTVARVGGDEFVVLLEGLDQKPFEASSRADQVGEKVRTTLNQPYILGGQAHHSTPSIGVTLFGDKLNSVEEVLKQADLAMYQAKKSGRNALRFFDPQMQTVVAARVALEFDLRQGIERNQFVLYYQPQVDRVGRTTGAEALVRWNHPQRGMVAPAEFISLAEDTGLILPLGKWVLETACEQLSIWATQPETTNLTLAINVSAHQFRQRDFVNQVLNALDDHGTNPTRLKLELTESLLLDDVEEIVTKMKALKLRGVSFSLDDFGTGYSSLSYLKQLPLDQLKIDKSFVRDVLYDSNDAAIARTIVALAHILGLTVIAEGVETEQQRHFLDSIGCQAYQGYLFSHPLPLDDFEKFAK